jgi:hypothetical protein
MTVELRELVAVNPLTSIRQIRQTDLPKQLITDH